MTLMTLTILLLPIIISLSAIILFKKSGVFSGILGIISVFIISYRLDELQLTVSLTMDALTNTLILTLSALLVIFPGLLLNNVLEKNGHNDKLQRYLRQLPIADNYKVLILMFGLLPALESITGFGVSLILAVPIFSALLGVDKASKVSMLSMNIMPWGTLALATVVGAQISTISVSSLGLESAYFCLLIFAMMAMVCVFLLNDGKFKVKDVAVALLLSLSLALLLILFNRLAMTEIAGVLAGFINFFLFYSLLLLKNKVKVFAEYRQIMIMLLPYVLVVVIVIMLRGLLYFYPQLMQMTTIEGIHLKFSLITSPFLAIFCVCLLFMKGQAKVMIPWDKTVKACSTLFVFILLSQLMNFSHAIDAIVSIISQQSNVFVHYLTTPLVGLLGGFITGSNLGGNALLMSMQSQLGRSYGDELLFSAIQNVSSGYAVFSSLPIIVLILTLLRVEDNPKMTNTSRKAMERSMLQFGLKCLLLIYLAIVVSIICLV